MTKIKYNTLNGFLHKYQRIIIAVGGWIGLGLLCTVIVYCRYPFNFTHANFYAEDGKYFVTNVYNHGFVGALFSLFDGYLIVLQYAATELAIVLNTIFGNGFVTLPKAIAVVSYAAIGFSCSLPWLLFRRKLGLWWVVLLVFMLAWFPLGGATYALLGTIGNLKFILIYVATLFLIYRNGVSEMQRMRIYVVDAILAMCVLTNVLIVALLPIGLYRYRHRLHSCYEGRSLRPLLSTEAISLLVLTSASLIYIVIIYLKGIPKMPGYLNGPIYKRGLMNSVYRSSWYGLLYPLQSALSGLFVACLLCITPTILLIKKYRVFSLIIFYAIMLSVLGFALNRPGVTQYFNTYTSDGGPGQFFYAGTLLFLFAAFYMLADWIRTLRIFSKAVFMGCILLYLIIALPLSGARTRAYLSYSNRPTIERAVEQACSSQAAIISIQIYPFSGWTMNMRRSQVC